MPENSINMQDNNNRCCGGCNNGGFLNGLFSGGNDSEILFFIIIFLLLFTNFGCCGCGRVEHRNPEKNNLLKSVLFGMFFQTCLIKNYRLFISSIDSSVI